MSESFFDEQHMKMFGRTKVTYDEQQYRVLVDKYRNNWLNDQAYGQTAKFAALVVAEEADVLSEGAAAAEKLRLTRAGESGVARYLRDVKTLYGDITDYHRFNMRMEELSAQAKAAPASKHKPMDIATFGPAIAAEGFNIGARLGGSFADEVTSIAKQQAEKLNNLNLPKSEMAAYMILVTQVEMKASYAEHMPVPDIPKFFKSQLEHYPEWAEKNGLSNKQMQEFDPVTLGMQRAAQAQEAMREYQR